MLNTAQNKKLLVKLTRALETYEPYVFTEICTLPFSMYETSERLTDVPEAALFQDPVQRPQGRIWGGEGRYCWFRASCTVLDRWPGAICFCARSLAVMRPCCGWTARHAAHSPRRSL